MSAESVAQSLKKPKRTAEGWKACCAAHDDRNPSLSISDTDDGKILVKCHAGCSQDAVIESLKRLGAWPTSNECPKEKSKRRIVATYDYTDENGTLLYQVVRYDPKDFRQRRPDLERRRA